MKRSGGILCALLIGLGATLSLGSACDPEVEDDHELRTVDDPGGEDPGDDDDLLPDPCPGESTCEFDLCSQYTWLCQELCEGCDDMAACFENSGHCHASTEIIGGDDGGVATVVTKGHKYRDELDGGDDIWNAGCHMKYDDDGCSGHKTFFHSDRCLRGGKKIYEWTQQTCHVGRDYLMYNCEDECKNKGYAEGGVCKTVNNHCPGGRPSAKCVCNVTPD